MLLDLLWLVPALPFASSLVLMLLGRSLPRPVVAALGVGSMGLAAALAIAITASFLGAPPEGHQHVMTLWTWFSIGDLQPTIAVALDPLSLVMMIVITVVGFLIHVYAAEFMWEDASFARFFANMNLFVGFMLMLVFADNLLQLYLGWEGVGLCSYLLIGFWHEDPANGRAAQKAFIVTRIGDTAMAIGLFLLVTQLGTFNIAELQVRAVEQWPVGSGMAVAVAALLLGGALGKSAQLPLQTWLPDAMAGPSPVSALIHAATMVTAGVYLIARTHVLFELAPVVLAAVAIIGLVTLLTAGLSALHQRDIKRILAYSTISQLGYMFLALGVSANGAAVNHLMAHACFKSTWFLVAGAVIVVVHHEHDIFKMGGLGRKHPILFWTMFFAGVGPFFSKDLILAQVWFSEHGHPLLWGLGVVGVFITSLYLFRLLFVVFLGEEKIKSDVEPGRAITIPLGILATASVVSAFVEFPKLLGYHPEFSGEEAMHAAHGTEVAIGRFAMGIALFGIYMAYRWFAIHPHREGDEFVIPHDPARTRQFLMDGWRFDQVYRALFVTPFVKLARAGRADVIDAAYEALARSARVGHGMLHLTQTGRTRWYAASLAVGTIVALGFAVFS